MHVQTNDQGTLHSERDVIVAGAQGVTGSGVVEQYTKLANNPCVRAVASPS
jgi:hypothetical protein